MRSITQGEDEEIESTGSMRRLPGDVHVHDRAVDVHVHDHVYARDRWWGSGGRDSCPDRDRLSLVNTYGWRSCLRGGNFTARRVAVVFLGSGAAPCRGGVVWANE